MEKPTKRSYGFQELVHRNAAEQLHVLEDVFGHLRLLLWFTLGPRRSTCEQRQKPDGHSSAHQARDRPPYSQPHSALRLCQSGTK
jgi:hypothetical protein